jgi:hypothetical protein
MDDYKAALLTGQRQELEKAYLGCYQEVAKINHQGSDHFTAVINRSLARGELVYTDLKHIVPYMPDLDSNKSSTRKKSSDGDSYVEESIWEPSGEKQWKHTMTVFRTTLLMCLAGNPNQTKLKLTKVSLDEFYDWLYGDQMLTRTPAPSLKVVMYTERKAWRKISIMIHEGLTLEAALKRMREDTMFWIMEVYERVNRGKGNGDYTDRSRSPGKGNWDNTKGWDTKGKTKYWDPKGKSKGKAKWNAAQPWQAPAPAASAPPSSPVAAPPKHKTWAKVDPKGKEYCKKHLVHQNCAGKCGRSHNCPIQKADGTPCNATHMPGPLCPHY